MQLNHKCIDVFGQLPCVLCGDLEGGEGWRSSVRFRPAVAEALSRYLRGFGWRKRAWAEWAQSSARQLIRMAEAAGMEWNHLLPRLLLLPASASWQDTVMCFINIHASKMSEKLIPPHPHTHLYKHSINKQTIKHSLNVCRGEFPCVILCKFIRNRADKWTCWLPGPTMTVIDSSWLRTEG